MLREASVLIIIAVLVGLCGVGVVSRFFLKNDNVVEEFCEEIILDRTGVEFDLSPDDETGGLIQNIDFEVVAENFK